MTNIQLNINDLYELIKKYNGMIVDEQCKYEDIEKKSTKNTNIHKAIITTIIGDDLQRFLKLLSEQPHSTQLTILVKLLLNYKNTDLINYFYKYKFNSNNDVIKFMKNNEHIIHDFISKHSHFTSYISDALDDVYDYTLNNISSNSGYKVNKLYDLKQKYPDIFTKDNTVNLYLKFIDVAVDVYIKSYYIYLTKADTYKSKVNLRVYKNSGDLLYDNIRLMIKNYFSTDNKVYKKYFPNIYLTVDLQNSYLIFNVKKHTIKEVLKWIINKIRKRV